MREPGGPTLTELVTPLPLPLPLLLEPLITLGYTKAQVRVVFVPVCTAVGKADKTPTGVSGIADVWALKFDTSIDVAMAAVEMAIN